MAVSRNWDPLCRCPYTKSRAIWVQYFGSVMCGNSSLLCEMHLRAPCRGSDGRAFSGLASLLMRCMGLNLQKLGQGEEVCLHFVVPYTQEAQEDYMIFVPSLVRNPLQPDESVCAQGPYCECNQTRLQLLALAPDKVFLSDAAFNIGLLPSAEEDERQGIEALSLAFGIPSRRIQEIFAVEGYVLTRDFACKILELLARRRSRVPTVLVGESGTGKTRAPRLHFWSFPSGS